MTKLIYSLLFFSLLTACGGNTSEVPTSRENWNSINKKTDDFDSGVVFYKSSQFASFISQRKEFEKLYTADSVQMVISRIYEFALKNASENKNVAQFEKIKKEINENAGTDAERITQHVQMSDYFDKGDFENYSKTASDYVDKYCIDNDGQLTWSAWQFYEHVTDTLLLKKALNWSKHAVELVASYPNIDTYAHLLYKLGDTEEAKLNLEKALEQAKKDSEDYSESIELLNEINSK